MIVPRFRRLENLMGVPLDQVTAEHITTGVEREPSDRLREDVDLDFKRSLYGKSDQEKRSLAADVCSMANTQGGVILLGVVENDQAEAVSVQPVELSDDEERRMRHVVADIIAPMPVLHVQALPLADDHGRGFYLLAVPRSPLLPHGVVINDSLRFYRRVGRSNMPLPESEVAELYRRRFRDGATQVERVARIMEEGSGGLGMHRGEYGLWLGLALVPSSPGSVTVSRATQIELGEWIQRFRDPSWVNGPFASGEEIRSAAGIRRLVFSGSPEPHTSLPRGGYAELHEDGASFVARRLRFHEDSNASVTNLWDEELVRAVFGMLRLTTQYAIRSGTSGDAVVQLALLSHRGGLQLCERNRMSALQRLSPIEGTPSRGRPTLPPRAISLDEVAEGTSGWVQATRLIVSDLFQAFTLAEVPQITMAGEFRSPHWESLDNIPALNDVPRVQRSMLYG